ncbi:hypothetical protein TorRG33x02_070780 [Trema orientale]|uniref:Late embryogenesis abundant protein n=1 Tax=Trema orientale TaxID=63057 RepID=A0A2P5FGX2_TREOI|nr:hypothetical protein TorRG33x02_070780 [Trema orientale]
MRAFTPSRHNNQPVSGYPLWSQYRNPSTPAATDNAGTVTGHPVSQLYGYPSNTRGSAAAAAAELTATANSAATNTYSETRRLSRFESNTMVIIALSIFFAIFFTMSVATYLIPPLPGIAAVTGSAGVHSVSDKRVVEDLDVGFWVQNNANKGMLYKNISLVAFHGDEKLSNFDVTGGAEPFEQGGRDHETVWLRLQNMAVPVERWVSRNDNNGSVVSGVISKVKFEFRARIRYRGNAWSKQEIPIKAECDGVKIKFTSSKTAREDFDISACEVYGQWDTHRRLMIFSAIFFPVLIFSSLVVYDCIIKHTRTRTQP